MGVSETAKQRGEGEEGLVRDSSEQAKSTSQQHIMIVEVPANQQPRRTQLSLT